MPRLVLATNNPGKVAEYRALLAGCGWELVTPAQMGVQLTAVETGSSYEENARIKAREGARKSGLVTLADDSGLEIEALGGAPGPGSARFLGEQASYQERFAEILRRLEGLPPEKRGATFKCVIALAEPGSEEVRFARGEVFGVIVPPRGEGGFGYDPIFWVPQHSATMAELPPHQKNIISHRARAAAQARQILKELLHERHQRQGGRDPAYRPGGPPG